LSFTFPQPFDAASRKTRSTILLVEDDPFQALATENALERHFAGIEKARDAAQAFIQIECPKILSTLALIVVGLHLPGLAGPQFVSELTARVPHIPVLVIGRPGESAPDYPGKNVRFLPHNASSQDVLAGTRAMLSGPYTKVA
jgi:CheY-like chemotaxis protein